MLSNVSIEDNFFLGTFLGSRFQVLKAVNFLNGRNKKFENGKNLAGSHGIIRQSILLQ